jgi:hypothetical protein
LSDAAFESVPWIAQPGPQLFAIQQHLVGELFFGGAVGGGKSDYLLGDFAQDVPSYGQHWHGVLFRKSYPQLEELIARSKVMYPAWFGMTMDCWSATAKQWTWPNGSTLKMRHAENDDSWLEYQGHQYGWIGFDELPHWANPTFFRQLKTRLRNGEIVIPNKRIRATGNPGGPGHNWIKQHWSIDAYPLGSVLLQPEFEGGLTKMFVRSCVTDNKILMTNDPGYVARLQDLGSPDLVRAYLEGDWSLVSGAFFPEFSTARHVIHPFEIPKHWMRFRACDWGSSAPCSVGWYAVSDGDVVETRDGPRIFPRGAMIKYRELYTKHPKEYNKGLKLTVEEVADRIRAMETPDDRIAMSVLDPSAFAKHSGPSYAERFAVKKVHFQKADNDRKSGWDMLRQRLKGKDGEPMIYFFTTCPDTIRTIPALQHDDKKVEDVDTDSEDHAGDETRYACMARPWVRPAPPAPEAARYKDAYLVNIPTVSELIESARKRRLENA